MASNLRIINRILEQTKYKPAGPAFNLKTSRVTRSVHTFYRWEILWSSLVSLLNLTISGKNVCVSYLVYPSIYPDLRNIEESLKKQKSLKIHILGSLECFSIINKQTNI